MTSKSEGIRRIVLISSFIFSISWISWIAYMSEGFKHIKPIGWVIAAVGIFIVFFIPIILSKIIYWIIEGFRLDRQTKN